MHVLLTRPYSQNSSLKMFRESSLVHISYTKTSSLTFSILQPMHSFDKLHDMGYFMIVHIQPFFIYQPSYHQIANKVAICQTNSIMALVFVILSTKSLIWQSHHKIVKTPSLLHICRPNENTAEV